MLKATILTTPNGDERLFLNDVEFPWPLYPGGGIGWLRSDVHPGKKIIAVDILVDDLSIREESSD